MKSLLAQTLLFVISMSLASAKDILSGLTPDQIAQVKAGKMVVTSEDVEGGPWPRLKVYTLVNAPVGAVQDVFVDYDDASTYIPNLLSATVINRPSPDIVDVAYTSKLPIVGKSTDTVRNWYSYKGNSVIVKWNLMKSSLADISTGELRVDPYGSGSILRYTNYVKPKSSLAIVAKGAALNAVKDTVAAIKAEAERRGAQFSKNTN